jgi:allantoinase
MTLQTFQSRRVVTPQGIRAATIVVEDGRIRSVVEIDEAPSNIPKRDFGEAVIFPGLVDSHLHINEPGRTEWEGFNTATRAAAAGGYTVLVDMPLNSLPATTSVKALEAKRAAAQGQCRVDWALWGGVVSDNQQHIEALAAAGVPGFKCFLIDPGLEGFTMVSESQLRAALPHLTKTGLPLLVHAELEGPVAAATRSLEQRSLEQKDWRRYETYLQSRPDEAELEAIDLLLRLCREYRFPLHIVHLSSARALERLRQARSEGLPVSVETCPHYLHFAAEEIGQGATLCKCAPPIRSRANREELWEGLRDGVIDLIATDHSPCPPEMKRLNEGNFRTAWGGISSLSIALPVIWTEAKHRGFTLTDIAKWMAEMPARLVGCANRKGRIAEGYDADLVVFAPEEHFVVTEDKLRYRHPLSAYLGEQLSGVVKSTFVRGKCVFEEGVFPEPPCGRELRR